MNLIVLIWNFLGIVIYSYLLFPDFLIIHCHTGASPMDDVMLRICSPAYCSRRSPWDWEVEGLGSHPGSASVCLEPVTHLSQHCDSRRGPRLGCGHCLWAWTSFLTSSRTCPLVEEGGHGGKSLQTGVSWCGLCSEDLETWMSVPESSILRPRILPAGELRWSCFAWRKRRVNVPATECPWASFFRRRELSGAFFLMSLMKYQH